MVVVLRFFVCKKTFLVSCLLFIVVSNHLCESLFNSCRCQALNDNIIDETLPRYS